MADNFDPDAYLNSQPAVAPQQPRNELEQAVNGPEFDPDSYLKEAKYGTVGQQLGTVAEGISKGLIGSTATAAAEKGLSKLGAPNLSAEDQAAREEINPVESGLSEASGFGLGLLTGTGEAKLIGKVGEGVLGLTKLGEKTGTLAKIASTGIKTGSEMAALQTDNEIAKAVNNTSEGIGTAAVNIGLSGILGGLGGTVLGTVPALWDTAANKLQTSNVIKDAMGQIKYLQDIKNSGSTLQDTITNEINDRIGSVDTLTNTGLKKELVNKLVADVTPEQIQQHVSEVGDLLNKAPKALQGERLFQNEVDQWKRAVTPTRDIVTNEAIHTPTNDQVFAATENLKRQFQEWAQYNKTLVPVSERPFRDAAGKVASTLKSSLEDADVWNAAGKVQKEYNEAVSPLYDIQKEFLGKFGAKQGGERVADPTKINSYIEQAKKSKTGLKDNYVSNYLDQTNKVEDVLHKAYLEHGLELPAEASLNPSPALRHVLETKPTKGVQLGQWMFDKGADAATDAGAKSIGGILGGGIGSLVGHPLAGAWMGEKALSPILSVLGKPLVENAINSAAARSSVDYLGNIAKGVKLINTSVENMFKSGEVLPKHLMPSDKSREKLQKSLDYVGSDPNNMMKVGGKLGHYLPHHAEAAATTAATAQNYFNSLKPKQNPIGPLDTPPPIDKAAQAKYNRQLDIAQQPLLVLQHAKDGTLQAQDIATLNTIYPGLHNKIANQVSQELINAKSKGIHIPYQQRMSMGLLMGSPLDSTQSASSMQAIMHSVPMQSPPQQQEKQHKPATNQSMKAIEKSNSLYATPLQNRSMHKGE